jgi:uncharacterized membrane protein YfhO
VLGVASAGQHTITLRYLPDEFVVGAIASLIVAILLALVVVGRRPRTRRPGGSRLGGAAASAALSAS